MAIKKDSIHGERIPNAAEAPRSERGPEHTTIPRRDLLTGAALVFIGSASGCGGSSGGGGSAGGSGSAAACMKPPSFPFADSFTAEFIGDPTKIKPAGEKDPWPGPDPNRKWPASGSFRNDVATEYETFVHVLMSVAYVGGSPPTYPSGSLGARIVQFLQTQNWPNGSPTPTEYKTEDRGTVTLMEMSIIQDRLLQALNSFRIASETSSSGGGSSWPPH